MAAEGSRITRRGFVALGSAAGASLLLPRGSVAASGRTDAADTAYVSRPDLNPPVVEVVVPAQGTAPGYLFLAPFNISAASGTYTSTVRRARQRGGREPASAARVGGRFRPDGGR